MINRLFIFILIFATQLLLSRCSNLETQIFQNDKFSDFYEFHFVKNGENVIVGTRDYILQFDLLDITKPTDIVNLVPDEETFNQCIFRGQTKDSCRNFVLVLFTFKNNTIQPRNLQNNTNNLAAHEDDNQEYLLSCGTNAFKPICTVHLLNNLNTITKKIDGSLLCPFSNQHQFTLLHTKGDLYFGGPTDLLARNKIFVRDSIDLKNDRKSFVQTFIDNSKFLYSDAKFIYSFETTKYVYFLFKETSVESLLCTNQVVSRIGRVCKKDLGSKSSIGNFFNTFLKAKISCSAIKHNKTINFDEIIDASFLSSDTKLFAIFRNQDINDATICTFNLIDIERQFNDAFSYQANLDTIWTRHEDQLAIKQFQCNLPKKKDEFLSLQQNQRKYQIADGTITAKSNHFIDNLFFDFKKVEVDFIRHFKTRTIIYLVYLITDDNQLMQFMFNMPDKKSCILYQSKLPLKNGDEVLKFRLNKKLRTVFIGSKNQLTKVRISNCDNFKTEFECLGSKDVYCVWSTSTSKCEYISNAKTDLAAYYKQPKFSSFCEQIMAKDSDLMFDKNVKCYIDDYNGECQCNYDLNKSNQYPFKITSCVVNGAWGEWNSWSICSNGKKYRIRKCDNPSPKNNGKECAGRSIEFEGCFSFLNTTDWSDCSAKCGDGIQTREKLYLFNEKYYRSVENRSCKLADCDDSSDPTEQRKNYTITDWSECGATCGVGYQFRVCGSLFKRRKCDTNKKCVGWSEWSEWSKCIEGRKSKKRYCHDQECKGEYKTTIVCDSSKNDTSSIDEQECESKIITCFDTGIAVTTLILTCILTFILGIILGISILFYYTNKHRLAFKRKDAKNISLRSVSSPLIRADKNTYVSNDGKKSSQNSSSKISQNKSSLNISSDNSSQIKSPSKKSILNTSSLSGSPKNYRINSSLSNNISSNSNMSNNISNSSMKENDSRI